VEVFPEGAPGEGVGNRYTVGTGMRQAPAPALLHHGSHPKTEKALRHRFFPNSALFSNYVTLSRSTGHNRNGSRFVVAPTTPDHPRVQRALR